MTHLSPVSFKLKAPHFQVASLITSFSRFYMASSSNLPQPAHTLLLAHNKNAQSHRLPPTRHSHHSLSKQKQRTGGRRMGGSPADSSASPDLSAALSELAQGRDSVVRLAVLLLENLPDDRVNDPSTARFLLEEIMDTITKAMAVLESGKNQDPVTTQADSPSSDVTSQSHGGKRKMQSPRKTSSRKRGNPYSCRRITSDTIEDGYTWRKYGQKEIYGAKYPRSYFRCTHKYDRECMATRQVQKSEENPSMYMITYFGEHACGTSATAMAACSDPCIISFESSNGGHAKQETSIIPSCQSLSQQREEEALSNVSTIEEPVYFEFGLEQSDSLSGLLSSATSYGMEFMDLEDIVSLDHIVLFQP